MQALINRCLGQLATDEKAARATWQRRSARGSPPFIAEARGRLELPLINVADSVVHDQEGKTRATSSSMQVQG